MQWRRPELKGKARTALLVSVAVAIIFLAILITRIPSVAAVCVPMTSDKSQGSMTHGGLVALEPKACSLGRQSSSALGIPLKVVSSSSTGITRGPDDSRGLPTTILDSGHVKLTISEGAFPNDTMVIALTATNIGNENVSFWSMDISGQGQNGTAVVSMDSMIVGCTHGYSYLGNVTTGYPNGTTVVTTQTFTVLCGSLAVVQGPIQLKPGESYTGYVVGPFRAGGVDVSEVGGGVNYSFTGSQSGFVVNLQGVLLDGR